MTTFRFRVELLTVGLATHGFRWMTLPMYRGHLSGLGHTHDLEVVAVGAHNGLEPVGLIVAEVLPDRRARLLSVTVRRRYRRQGCARQMLATLETALVERCATTLFAGGADGAIHKTSRGLLAATGFDAPLPVGHCYELHAEELESVVLCPRPGLPASFLTTPWRSLSSAQRTAIQERQRRDAWYPETLSPFRHEATIEPASSLALTVRDEVVGFAIGHRIASDVVHYATLFVREDIRGLGAGEALFFAALERHCTSEETRRLKGRFVVRNESGRMSRIIERRLGHLATNRTRYFETTKRIRHP